MTVEEILQEFRIKYDKGLEYFKLHCPFHNDSTPSGNVHCKTGFFNCFACGKRASLVHYLVKYTNLPLFQIKARLGAKSDCKNPVDPIDVERDHVLIWEHPTFLADLRYRCISDASIRKYRLGVRDTGTEKRISIPIINEVGEYANLRLYIPGAKERKFLNLAGKERNKIRLYPIEQLEYDQILVVGGEMKAVAAAEILNQYDIGAITATCGENVWPNELTDRFRDKLVWVNLDEDETGRKFVEQRCRILKQVARAVHKLTLPLVADIPKGDINDFIRLGGDLYQELLKCPEWEFVPGGEVKEDSPVEVDFRVAYSNEYVGRRVKFPGVVTGINSSTYLAAQEVDVICGRDEKFCTICDINAQAFAGMSTRMKINKEHPAILALIGERTEEHNKTYKECFRIPSACRQCQFQVKSSYSITEVRLDESLDPSSRLEPITAKAGYLVNGPTNLENQTYVLTGRHYPSPKTQVSSFLVSHCEPTMDALDAYSPDDVSGFELFKPKRWDLESLEEKITEIYDDLEANVTKVWQRRTFHIAIDLAYHSLLYITFGDTRPRHGYIEFLAVGDSGQAKSETIDRIRHHYGLGFKIDSKNVTKSGLTIGLEKSSTKHFAILGAMPRNDKGLIIFEELKGMHPLVFQALTEVRSSGIVQITKIAAPQRSARCRIIAFTNPPEARKISSYAFGIDSALGVIGTNEDLRRFDLVNILGEADVDTAQLHATIKNPPQVEHKFNAELCQKLVLKAWKCDKVVFPDKEVILDSTKRLIDSYGEGPPVLDPNSSHIKIAKMSAALAARTHSYEDNVLIVRDCHVHFIEKYLNQIYSAPSCKLGAKSKSIKDSTKLREIDKLIDYLKTLANVDDVLAKISNEDTITNQFVRDLVGDFYAANLLFSRLIQSNAIVRIRGDKYVKNPEFTQLIINRKFGSDPPTYIPKEKF